MAKKSIPALTTDFEKWDGQIDRAFAIRADLSTLDYYNIGSIKLEHA